MKILKENLLTKEARISYLEISLLIISSFAFSYLIYQPFKNIENNPEWEEALKQKTGLKQELKIQKKSLIISFLASIANQFNKPMFPGVSAVELALYTCRETKLGEKCVELESADCDSLCKTSCFPGRRNEFSECKVGCCINPDGKCQAGSSKAECEKAGIWKDNSACNPGNVAECRTGCCVLGSGVKALVTEAECGFYSYDLGFEIEYYPGENEPACLARALTQAKGACVTGSSCKFTTEQECYALTNSLSNFREGILCTNPELNTNCEPTTETTCVQETMKDEVYFLDSCGNIANIYDSSKANDAEYWERVFSKDESCNPSSNNANSPSCGNCAYMLGSRCKQAGETKPNYGEHICQDMNCQDAPNNNDETKDRKNGESWCLFDGSIGGGIDLVGSRHLRANCIEGEIKIEPCDDFRNSICVQSDMEINENEKFSNAACRINNWQGCLAGGSEDCGSKTITPSKDIGSFDVSFPSYPPGFDLSTREGKESANAICSQAYFKCVVVYQHKLSGWQCIYNCECEEESFTRQMSEWCSSLGDCGFKMNIGGACTKNYIVTGAPDSGNCAGSTSWGGNYPEPGKGIDEYLAGGDGTSAPSGEPGEDYVPDSGASNTIFGVTAGITGGGGAITGLVATAAIHSAISGITWSGAASLAFTGSYTAASGWVYTLGAKGALISTPPAAAGAASTSATSPLSGMAPAGANLASMANGFIAGLIVTGVTFLLTKLFGLQGDAALVMAIAGAVGATVAAILVGFKVIGFKACFIPTPGTLPACLVIIIILIIIATILGFSGLGDTEERVVEFQCKPWTPPTGGKDCDKCNEDEFKPCSRYRCQSLGSACKFLNEGSEKELCEASKNDGKAPQIIPWNEALLEGYVYEPIQGGIKVRSESDECVQAYTPISFGILTDKASQCKYDVEHKAKFEDMIDYFGGSNFYEYNHSMALSLPSPELIAEQFNISTEFINEKYGNLKFMIRCQDDWGNWNVNEYLIQVCVKPGADTTSPIITKYEPADNAKLAYNVTEKDMKIFVNEPSNCKYSSTDKDYSQMENNFACKISLAEQEVFGWPCETSLINLSLGNNKYYIRCKDKPWLEANHENISINQQSYEYNLKVSESELSISSLEPAGEIIGGAEPFSVKLEAHTLGGAEQGKAKCEYKWNENWILFYNSFSSTHTQTLSLFKGNYNIPIKCEDTAGNIVSGEFNFKLQLDTITPRVVRVYKQGGSLYLYTNEDSACAYSFKNCRFNFANGTLMSGGLGKEHTADWKANTYFIKCKDSWNNEPGGCSIVVKPETM